MSTFVPLTTASRIGMHLAPDLEPAFVGRRLNSKFGFEVMPALTATIQAQLLSGKDAGSYVTKIAANQRAVLKLGSIYPPRYQALIAVNPAFNEVATVQCPTIVEPKEGVELDLVINAHKEVDLAHFQWFIRMYLTE